MSLLAIGLNHKTAPVSVRERLAFHPDTLPGALGDLRRCTGVDEAIIVSTCNRTELYCSLEDAESHGPVEWLATYHRLRREDVESCLYSHPDAHAVRHVLRVASGLDSMVIGEPQILGQLKAAYRIAAAAGTSGKLLNKLFQYAFTVAKRVRTDTAIGSSPVSIAFAAVRLATQVFGDLDGARALLLGAGDTIELCARHLHENRLGRLIVANRSLERAQALATKFDGYGIALADVPQHLEEADIVIAATTSPLPLIGLTAVERARRVRRRRPMLLLDLGVPRNVDPSVATLEDVYLYTLDDLESVIRENLRSRRIAALEADEIIATEVQHYMDWLQSQDAVATIRALRDRADTLREDAIMKARRQLASGEDPAAVIETLAHQLTNRLTHDPTVRLREAAADGRDELLRSARELFDLD